MVKIIQAAAYNGARTVYALDFFVKGIHIRIW